MKNALDFKDIIVFMIYFVIVSGYGYWIYQRKKKASLGTKDFFLAEGSLTWWAIGATIPVEADIRWALGLSAILEEQDGTKSYWALAHPPGDKPDFHDPACFAAHLP